MSHALTQGTHLVVDNLEKIISGIHCAGDVLTLFDKDSATSQSVSLKHIRYQIAQGEVIVLGSGTLPGVVRSPKIEPATLEKLLFNKAVFEQIRRQVSNGHSASSAIESLLGKQIDLKSGKALAMCSKRQAYRIWEAGKIDGEALLPAYRTRGNRTPRYSTEMQLLIGELVTQCFTVRHSKVNLKTLTDTINIYAHARDLLNEGQQISRKAVRHFIMTNISTDMDYKRLDPRLAKAAKAVASNRIPAELPFHRVEIDTVHLPFYAIDNGEIVDDLHMMLTIECATSIVPSWWLMRGKPTTEDTFQCIERAMYPKRPFFEKMGIKSEVDPYGGIIDLHMDNGQENSRQRLVSVVAAGINPHWTPIHSGHCKPFIERFNGALKRAIETLPGCTRFNGKDGARSAIAREEKLLTVGELEHRIVRWIYEKWPNQVFDRFITADYEINEAAGITPAERYKYFENNVVMPLPPRLDQWRQCKLLKTTRKLNLKTGVSFEGFDFKGDELRDLIVQFGTGAEIQVLYDPHDYRTIFVPAKDDGRLVQLVNAEVRADTPAYSYVVAKQKRKTLRASHAVSPISKQYDIDTAMETVANSAQKMSTKERRRAHNAQSYESGAKARAAEKPLPAPSADELLPDSYIADDKVPDFAVRQK